MKNVTIYVTHNYTVGADDDTYYTFSKTDAENRSADIRAHLTAKELESRDIYAEGYEIRIPDDYTVTTAEQLVRDLSNGDVESPDYDALTGQFASRQTYYNDAEPAVRYLPTDEIAEYGTGEES